MPAVRVWTLFHSGIVAERVYFEERGWAGSYFGQAVVL